MASAFPVSVKSQRIQGEPIPRRFSLVSKLYEKVLFNRISPSRRCEMSIALRIRSSINVIAQVVLRRTQRFDRLPQRDNTNCSTRTFPKITKIPKFIYLRPHIRIT